MNEIKKSGSRGSPYLSMTACIYKLGMDISIYFLYLLIDFKIISPVILSE